MDTIQHLTPEKYVNKWHKLQAQGHLNALLQQVTQKTLDADDPKVEFPRNYTSKDYKKIPLRNFIQ